MPDNEIIARTGLIVTPASRPGYKTTEFWLSFIATLLGLFIASGVLPSDGPWAQVVGLVTSALASLGYTVARSGVKAAEANSQAFKGL